MISCELSTATAEMEAKQSASFLVSETWEEQLLGIDLNQEIPLCFSVLYFPQYSYRKKKKRIVSLLQSVPIAYYKKSIQSFQCRRTNTLQFRLEVEIEVRASRKRSVYPSSTSLNPQCQHALESEKSLSVSTQKCKCSVMSFKSQQLYFFSQPSQE